MKSGLRLIRLIPPIEDRLIAVGRTAEGKALFVAFTFRRIAGQLFIRPVSARYMHKREISRYEKETRSE